MKWTGKVTLVLAGFFVVLGLSVTPQTSAQQKPNIVMLMTDDTGWNDFGAYTNGGAANGHPTPNIDRMAIPVSSVSRVVRRTI